LIKKETSQPVIPAEAKRSAGIQQKDWIPGQARNDGMVMTKFHMRSQENGMPTGYFTWLISSTAHQLISLPEAETPGASRSDARFFAACGPAAA
jgi:hypothetical protein